LAKGLFFGYCVYKSLFLQYKLKRLNMGFGGKEIWIILIIILVLFGGRKIPELMRGMGRGIREFNDAKNNVKKEIEENASAEEKKD
jgi:sec-independent protein translocase protein TatA